jgi:hypothetical protein
MQMQGWKTESMFRRYAIVDQTDMQRALELEQQKRDEALKSNANREQLEHSYIPPCPRA